MAKIVINTCYGGFGLSDAAYKRLIELGVPCVDQDGPHDSDARQICKCKPNPLSNNEYWGSYFVYGHRDDPALVQVVEEMGKASFGFCAKLLVVEIPDGIEWEIDEYDGSERVAEKHRTWP